VRQQNASHVLAIAWASVSLPVHLSVTLLHCIKMVQARITKFALWAATRTLVFCDKITCPSNKGVKERYSLKKHYFATIGSSIVKIADSYTLGIAIPGSQYPSCFHQSRVRGLAASQFRDFGII